MRAAPRILRVGLPDRYVTHGKPALLHEEVGFTGRAHRRARPRRDRDRRSPALARRLGRVRRLVEMKRPAGEAGRFGEEGCG